MRSHLVTIIDNTLCPKCGSTSILIHINKIAVVYECQHCELEVMESHQEIMERKL